MDRINIFLALNVSNSLKIQKYFYKIIEKINEKLEWTHLPIALIIDNLKENLQHENILDILKIMTKEIIGIKIIVIEKTLKSELNLGINLETLIITDFNYDDNNERKKI